MASMEIIERLGVELSLESDSFTKKMATVNKAIKNADKDFKATKKGIEEFDKSFVGLGKTIDKNKRDIELYSKKLEEQEKEFNSLNKKLEEHQKELKEIEEAQGKNSKAYKDQRDKVTKCADSIIKLNQDMDKSKQAIENSSKALKSNQEKYDTLGKAIETTDTKLEEIKGTLEEAQKDFNDLSKYIDNADKVFKRIQDTTDSFKKQLDINNQALGLYKNKVDEVTNELNKNEAKHKELNYQINKTELELNNAKSAYGENSSEAQQLGNKLNGLKDDYMRLGKEIDSNKQDLNKYQTEVNNTEKKMNDLSQAIKKVPWKEMEKELEGVKDDLEDAQGKLDGFTSKLSIIGGASVFAFGEASDATSKFQGALGLTKEEAERLTQKAQELNKKGFEFDYAVESILQVQKVLKDTLHPDEIDTFTRKAMALGQTFDVDINDIVKTSSLMMKNFGIDGEETLDILTYGFQNGLDVSGDFLDTLWEYSPQFVDMGYTAQDFIKILVTGMQEGAFNTDKLADGVKEFRLRLTDVGKEQKIVLESLGFNVKTVEKAFNEGGEAGKEMAFKVATELMKVDDETKRNKMSVALFGTQFEDVGDAVVKSITSIGTEQLELQGTTNKMTEAFEESFGAKLRGKLAELKEPMEKLGEALLPTLDVVGELITKFADWFSGLDEGTVETIVNFGLLVAGITPLLKVGSFATTTMGGLIKVIGGVAAPMAGATGATSGLSAVLGTLGGFALPLVIGALLAVGAALGDNENALLKMQEKWGAFGTIFSGICEFISGVWDVTVGFLIDTGALCFDILAAMIDGPGGNTVADAWDRYNEKLVQRAEQGASKLTLQNTRGMSQMLFSTEEGLHNIKNVYQSTFDSLENIVGMETGQAASLFAQKLEGMSNSELQILEGMNNQTQTLFWGIREGMSVEEKTTQVEKNIEKMKAAGLWNVDSMREGMTNGIDVINNQLETRFDTGTTKVETDVKDMVNNTSTDLNTLNQNTNTQTNQVQQNMDKNITTGTDKVEKEFKDTATNVNNSVQKINQDTKTGMSGANNNMQQEATNIYKGVTTSFYMMEQKTKQHATDMMKGVNTSTNVMASRSKTDGTNMYKGVSTSANNMARNAKQAATDMMRGVTNSTSQMASRAIADWNRIRNAYSVPIRGKIEKTTVNKTMALSRNADHAAYNIDRTIQSMSSLDTIQRLDINNKYFRVDTPGQNLNLGIKTTNPGTTKTDKMLETLIKLMIEKETEKGDIIVNNILDSELVSQTTYKKIDKKLGTDKTIKNRFKGGKKVVK